MARFRFGGLMVLSLVLVLAAGQTARSDNPKPTTKPVASPQLFPPPATGFSSAARTQDFGQPANKGDSICRIYSLSNWCDDPSFGKWVADTIQEVIQPGSWSTAGGKNVLKYNASTGILVVYHTPAAHAQVDAFLKNVKESLPQGKQARAKTFSNNASALMPAKYSPADSTGTGAPAASKSTSYPVPAQAKQPKHLFHFIIRYEGEGIIDSNVAGVIKQLYGTDEDTAEAQEEKTSDVKETKKAKKKKTSKQPGKSESSSMPALDQLFHLIVRYEGDGIIDSTVADVIKAVYSGSNNTTSGNSPGGTIRNDAPAYNSAPGSTLPGAPAFVPMSSSPLPTLPAPPGPGGTY